MARRSPSRWLAPVAIVAVGVTAYGILKAGVGDDGGGSGSSSRPAAQRTTGTSTGGSTTKTVTGSRTYVVRSGDTLSSIALETGVPVAKLQSLNPDVDVQALQPGQRLKLRS
ncbi:MAG TPA: LysM domain-containing protein [Solirubrobacteraceae bacterium]|jgi:N-acetylmuramoyl-L-alanine amidase|nr:LysM domain-containing protein [Solirubrobacteraceae bacterium]